MLWQRFHSTHAFKKFRLRRVRLQFDHVFISLFTRTVTRGAGQAVASMLKIRN